MSLYYTNPNSVFMKAARGDKAWKRFTPQQRAHLLSDAILLNILCAVTAQVARVRTHNAPRGCVMDYCDRPFMIRDALGAGFSFCRMCQGKLRLSPDGRAVLDIARRLTARPFYSQRPQLFISYSRLDVRVARRLRVSLIERGYSSNNIFMDESALSIGVKWEGRIKNRMRKSDFVIVCVSRAANQKEGYYKTELAEAIRLAPTKPPGFLLPVRIDRGEIPKELKSVHCVDLFPDWERAVDRLSSSIAGYRL